MSPSRAAAWYSLPGDEKAHMSLGVRSLVGVGGSSKTGMTVTEQVWEHRNNNYNYNNNYNNRGWRGGQHYHCNPNYYL